VAIFLILVFVLGYFLYLIHDLIIGKAGRKVKYLTPKTFMG